MTPECCVSCGQVTSAFFNFFFFFAVIAIASQRELSKFMLEI